MEQKKSAALVQVSAPEAIAKGLPPPSTLDAKGIALKGAPATEEVTLGNFVFVNRVVPEPPGFLRADNTRLLVERDYTSNAWVWMGSPILSIKISELAKLYDKAQSEIDLDFVLVLISGDTLDSRGFSVFRNTQASWLDSLSLIGDTGSLRIASGSWGAEINYQNSVNGLSLLAQPVIRCIDGVPWEFANDTDVPIPQSEVVEGVVRQSLQYRNVGFGLSGTARVVGSSISLEVMQRNGSVSTRAVGEVQAPEFALQKLNTSLKLAWWEWSVLGGIQVDREEISKGLFWTRKTEVSRDYLVIFVRPRHTLSAPPRALPVVAHGADGSRFHPLLPDRDEPAPWLKEEFDFIDGKRASLLPIAPHK